MSDVYWVWRSVAGWGRSGLDLATRGLRGRSPNRLGLNLSVDHEDRTPTHGYELKPHARSPGPQRRPARPGPQRSLRSESSGVPALPNVKTARRWRGIVAFTHLAREGRMTVTIGRRELLAALRGAAAAWPFATRAQQERMRRIGVLAGGAVATDAYTQERNATLAKSLQQLGWVVGRSV